jgi:hypothetical protein
VIRLVNVATLTPEEATWLLHLCVEGRRQYRRDGLVLPAHVRHLLNELEALAAEHQGRRPAATEARTLSTDEAAELLDVTPRRITTLLREHKLAGRKVLGVWRIDAADAERRASERIGTPSVTAQEDLCA